MLRFAAHFFCQCVHLANLVELLVSVVARFIVAKMACVEAASIPVPNSRKKTDELFLYWLSEPSTQELLRKELAKLSGVPYSELDDKSASEVYPLASEYSTLLSPSSAVTNVLRPGSPNVRTPSPPLLSHRSPKSPRGARRSPKKTAKSPGAKQRTRNGLQQSFDEVDYVGEDMQVVSGSSLLSSTHNHVHVVEASSETTELHLSNGRRSRSHSPKPESLPLGPNHKHSAPKPSSHIPRFYFPNGKPHPEENLQERFSELGKLFQTFKGAEASFKQFGEIMKVSVCLCVM